MTPADLTDKEREVAKLVAEGLHNKQIAGQLHVSDQRVRVIISSVAYKIGADESKNERVQVAIWWLTHECAAIAKRYSA